MYLYSLYVVTIDDCTKKVGTKSLMFYFNELTQDLGKASRTVTVFLIYIFSLFNVFCCIYKKVFKKKTERRVHVLCDLKKSLRCCYVYSCVLKTN